MALLQWTRMGAVDTHGGRDMHGGSGTHGGRDMHGGTGMHVQFKAGMS